MKVLHINDYQAHGGAEVMIARIIELLQDRGIQTSLFTIDDVPLHRRTPWTYIANGAACRALRARLEAFGPDVIHPHNFYHELSPAVLAEIGRWRMNRRCRVVMTAHDYHLVCPNSGGSWFRSGGAMHTIDSSGAGGLSGLLTRQWDHRGHAHSMLKVMQHAWNYGVRDRRRVLDLVCCPSRFIEGLVRSVGLPTMRLPHPAAAVSRDRADRHGPLRMVFAGRLEPEKGVAEFLSILPGDWAGIITIIGDGSEMARCRRIVNDRRLTDRVEFPGRLPHAQTTSIIARCHVLALPSLCLENYPLTLIEALSSGTSVLVSDHQPLREVVEEFGTGYVFKPGDSASLRAALSRIWASHQDHSLNAFEPSCMLAERSAGRFTDQLLSAYSGSKAGSS